MSEFCRREKAIASSRGTQYFYNDPVVSINRVIPSKGKSMLYKVLTGSGKAYITEDLILNIHPPAIFQMSGDVINDLKAQSQMYQPKNVTTFVVVVQFDSIWWIDLIEQLWGSYRVINPSSCLNRIEFPKTPVGFPTKSFRAVYSDYNCLIMWRRLLNLGENAIAAEVMRELNEEFGPMLRAKGLTIPQPIAVEYKLTDFGEFFPNKYVFLIFVF